MAQIFVNAVTPHLITGARMGARWAGPRVAKATTTLVEVAHEARDWVRDLTEERFEPLTEAEYKEATESGKRSTIIETEIALIDFSDGEKEDLIRSTLGGASEADKAHGNGSRKAGEPRQKPIKLRWNSIRASRDVVPTEAFGGSIPQLSHWAVEIDNVYYELRAHKPDMPIEEIEYNDDDPRETNNPQNRQTSPSKQILYRKLGQKDKKIKLEVTANKEQHNGIKTYEVGSTDLETGHIIKIASLIFRRFAQSYNLVLDNCQLFCQLLAETVGGKSNAPRVREILSEKSVLKLPIAASWVVGPAYHFMATVHHVLPKKASSADGDDSSSRCGCRGEGICLDCGMLRVSERVEYVLENWERFYYHPRLYDSRRRTIKEVDDFMERIGF